MGALPRAARACAASRAPSAGARPPPPRGGRCRPQDRTSAPAGRRRSARAPPRVVRCLPRRDASPRAIDRSGERRVERDLGDGRERLRDRAVLLRTLGRFGERRRVQPRNLAPNGNAIFVIPSPGRKVTVADVSSWSGGVPACARPCDRRHREARCLRRGDQLLGAGLPVRGLGARGPADVQGPKAPLPTSGSCRSPPSESRARSRSWCDRLPSCSCLLRSGEPRSGDPALRMPRASQTPPP